VPAKTTFAREFLPSYANVVHAVNVGPSGDMDCSVPTI
jgi:hypothetical protein